MRPRRRRRSLVGSKVFVAGALTVLLCWTATALPASDDEGRHQAVGKVTKADGQTGWLELATLGGPVTLHFPPSALAGLKQGDRVAVDLHFSRTPAAGAPTSVRLVGDPSWRGHHATEGEITTIDAHTGLIHVNTSEGAMIMHFLPAAVRALKVGDRLTIAFSLKPCPAGAPCLGGRHR